MNQGQNVSRRIAGLDGLRAIAVLMVFVHHNMNIVIGNYGVWLFFVISGFLVVEIIYRDQLKVAAGLITPKDALMVFLGRRAVRIFPIYYLFLLLTIPLSHVARTIPHVDAVGAVMNVAYLSNFWIAYVMQSWIGPLSLLWSLSVEQQFYVIFSVGAFLLGAQRIKLFTLSIVGAAIVAKVCLVHVNASSIAIYTDTLVNAGIIALGGLAALSIAGRPKSNLAGNLVPLLSLIAYFSLPLVTAAAGIELDNVTYAQSYAPVFAMILVVSVYFGQSSWTVRMLETWPLRSLGKVSYGFYLYHSIANIGFIAPTITRVTGFTIDTGSFGVIAFNFCLTIVAATLSWHLIEQPLLRRRPSSPGVRESPLRAA